MSSVKRTLIGGSAVPLTMIERFWKEHGVEVAQGWGMTEMSPLGTITRFNRGERDLPDAERFAITAKQGRPVFGCEMKIIDDAGNDLPSDGSVSGNMVVRGPWIVKGYMKGDGKSQFLEDDWFQTGDVCKIESDGSVRDHRPLQGRHQVGRRMDQLDRPRERRHGLPGRRRGRRDRRAPSQVGRAAAADRGAPARCRRHQG